MKTFADIIDAWPSRREFAGDCGVSYNTAKQWVTRDSIPPCYWSRIVLAASERGLAGVTLRALVQIAETRRSAA